MFSWFLFRLKFLIEKEFIEESQKSCSTIDPVLISIFSKIMTVILLFFIAGIIFQIMGIPFETLLIFRGAISIAVGFGAQSLLSNFFGSLMILVNRPFRVGDWISSPDKKVEGIIEEIGWTSTRIRTLERRPLYVPNSIFTHIVIMNSSLMYNRHIKQIVCIRYQDVDKIDKITHDIERMLRSHCGIDQDQSIMADWIEFGSHALHIEIYAFTKTTNRVLFRKIQQDICIKVVRVVENYGAKIAIPLHFVHTSHDHEVTP
ncbi:mechanosensitive ion channel family protein [Candidatus Babeliales bacterium]|nr:mechanosensitive ion channel family protein [Candidatus Babeliales bacterium]